MSPRNYRLESILYGNEHQKLRKRLKPYAVGSLCTRCKEVIKPGQPIDLDHFENSTQYRGWAHRSCNRRAGGLRRQAQLRDPDPRCEGQTRW
jgi:hypothetical protein